MSDETGDEFKEEKGRINADHDFDTGALGERHLGRHGGQGCAMRLAELRW